MAIPVWHEEPIAKHQDRAGFDCGDAALNEFLQKHARQNHERGASKTFVAVEEDGKTIVGYYSLCPASVEYARAPEVVRKGLARYEVPAFRLARLAVRRDLQGQGLGGQLLLLAGKRCLWAAAEVGGVVLVIDAKNERVARWYALYGAVPLADAPLMLVLPLETIRAALREAGRL
jgi:GNAT superfamily N-acetyltransferase